LEHVEALQRKFDEFQKDMEAKELRVIKVLDLADRLVKDRHPEVETINSRKEVRSLHQPILNNFEFKH